MVHPTLWAGENWSQIAGAGRSNMTQSMIICIFCIAEMDKVEKKSSFMQLKIFNTQMQKSTVFSVKLFLMSGNDQYGRRLLLWGDTAEIFGFTLDIQMRYLVSMNIAVKRLRMRELSGEEVEEHQLMMMIVHRYRWSLIAVILPLLAYYIIFIVSTAVCCVFWP